MGAVFVAIEGLDGSGQSTQCELLRQWFENQGKQVHVTKEPTDNLIGGLIRAQLTSEWKSSPECLQLLFAADRAHHLEKEIEPALEKGVNVVTDRYFFSSVAYGGVNTDLEWLKRINSLFRVPDAVFYLNVPASECLQRMKGKRFKLELFEKEEYLEKVRKNYLKISKDFKNFHVIDGTQSREKVHAKITSIIQELV
jgi:dTMP kinase